MIEHLADVKFGLVLRTVVHLKPIQVWFQAWRRVQKVVESHPKCGTGELPEFTFLNVAAKPKGWNDASVELLWRYNLHYFDYLHSGSSADATWRNLVLRWIAENPKGAFPGWDPYPTSLRIVNWVKWLSACGSQLDVDADAIVRIEASLRAQTAWLMGHLEYQLLANHLLANAKALVVAGKYFGSSAWYGKGMSIYRRQLPEQTCGDGVNFERSPMYHAIIFEDMLDLAERTGEPLFMDYAAKMATGMKVLTGPDGKIAKFNDAAEGIAKAPADLLARAERLRLQACETQGNKSGFLRKEAGKWVLLAKTGEIGPSYQPGHAHADTYSFELWKDGKKVVGDTGCSTYVPGAIRSYERSTKAHNTVVVDGENSSEVWASHRVGRRFDRERHRREFTLTQAGLDGIDFLAGKGEHDVEVRFHLPPGVSKEEVSIDCPGSLSWTTCDFAEGWNRRKPGLCAVYFSRLTFPATIRWRIR